MRRRRRLAAIGGLLLAAAVALTACAKDQGEAETPSGAMVTLVEPGFLTVCTSLPYAPFEEKNGDQIEGFDVDIVDLVAEKLGVEQKIVDIEFSQIKGGAALSSGKCDLAAAGMTITEERKKNLTFSDPYFDEVIAFMTAKDKKIMSIDEVKAQGLTLGVQASTTSLDYAVAQGLDPKQYNDAGKELEALKSGAIDVILQDFPVIYDWLSKPELAEKYQLGGSIETGAQYGLGLKKDADPELLKVINDTLAEAKSNGTYDEIYQKWIGEAPQAAPSAS